MKGVDGDVSVNQRKGKVKQLFDLELNVESGSGVAVRVAEFTADASEVSDLELKGASGLAKEEKAQLLDIVFRVLEQFKADLHTTHGLPLLIEANSCNPNSKDNQKSNSSTSVSTASNSASSASNSASSASNIDTSNSTSNTTANTNTSNTTAPSHTQSIQATLCDSVDFNCPPSELYKFLTEQPRILAWSRSPPTGLPQLIMPGAPFTLFNGNIRGKFVEMQAPGYLKLDWQLKDWSQPTQVIIKITSTDSGCRMDLEQIGVPQSELESIRANWHTYYWKPIKSLLGMF